MRDLTGTRFGRLVVTGFSHRAKSNYYWNLLCDCGNGITSDRSGLSRGVTKSCGCLHKEIAGKINRKHGLYKHPLYNVWEGMNERCYNKNAASYNRYGGRGITIYYEWRSDFKAFYNWAMSTGYAKGLQIDRINNDGNYEPSNCRWVTPSINTQNSTSAKLLHNSVSSIINSEKTAKELSIIHSVSVQTIYDIKNKKTWKELSK